MAKIAKTKKPATQTLKKDQQIVKYLIAFPVVALVIKFVVMFNLQAGGFAGADGENYLKGVDGLLNEGFFSKEGLLTYWPAGYPILIWPMAFISITKFVYILSVIQSLLFAWATFFFTRKLHSSPTKWLAFTSSLIISFNPTLSLSSLVIGYESVVASCLLIISGIIISEQPGKIKLTSVISVGLVFSFANFLQPRFIAVSIVVFIFWAFSISSKKEKALVVAVGIAVAMVLPATLIYRNLETIGTPTISTNLGVTMRLGAGDQTSGGYNHSGPDVPCEPKTGEQGLTDNQIVRCVITWYLTNPVKTLNLAVNKTQFFWSPWSGPKAEGTMARNPWLKVSPVQNIKKSKDGAKLAFGLFGETISYIWILGQLFFLFLGYCSIRRHGHIESRIANLLLIPIVLSWLISVGTIGDHRFRIPTMGLSLCLQVAGFIFVREKITKAL
jgi:hypothetical protein